MLHKNQLPLVLDLYNQSIRVAFNVKHRERVNIVGVGINFSDILQISPLSILGDFVPVADWPLQRVVGGNSISPRAFADYVQALTPLDIFAVCEVAQFNSQSANLSIAQWVSAGGVPASTALSMGCRTTSDAWEFVSR